MTRQAGPGARAAAPSVRCERGDAGSLEVELGGPWRLTGAVPAASGIEEALRAGTPVSRVRFGAAQLGEWDSSLLVFLERVRAICAANKVEFTTDGLPAG